MDQKIQDQYQYFVAQKIILHDPSRKTLALLLLEKSRHNFIVAQHLKELSQNSKLKTEARLPTSFIAYDWVINAAYYSMYMAAQGVLAQINIKCENHTATPTALEFHFVLQQKLELKYVEQLREHQNIIIQKDIIFLRDAKSQREMAQYSVLSSIQKEQAITLINVASRFIERMEQLSEVISK